MGNRNIYYFNTTFCMVGVLMKFFKCPDCKSFKQKKDNVILVRCGCGGKMEEVDSKHYPVDNRNEVEKICDANKCESCPIRGTKCFGALEALKRER